MFENDFSHYLSYGATDQQSVRDLTGSYDGLLVPGTVAAFQKEGTGGFVLSLSATEASVPYVIDPRFPLFQQALPHPKKSHESLAEVLGVPDLVSPSPPSPGDFTDDLIVTISEHWAAFNMEYRDAVGGKFDKYAQRLHEEVRPGGASTPESILPPYFIVHEPEDRWWTLSKRLFEATEISTSRSLPCTRVVACADASDLEQLIQDIDDEEIIVWVSGMEELSASPRMLAEYGSAIRAAQKRQTSTFALYGGFFSVLLSSVGLAGSCHGIGYGEFRHWVELPQSGPPPPRYYLPLIHRYVSQELAYQLWMEDPQLAECNCAECNGQPPIALEYHSLMKHSVLCRAAEIEEWSEASLDDAIEALESEGEDFQLRVLNSDLPDFLKASAERNSRHIQNWISGLRILNNEA